MKNYLLLAMMLFGTMAIGQTTFGVGASYDDNFGVHARAKLDLAEKINVVPQFTYWFADIGTLMVIDGNLTYDVAMVADMPVYAIGGLGLTRFSFSGASSTNLGLNLGAGIMIAGNIYVEPRYVIGLSEGGGSTLGFHGGYYF